MRGSAGENDVRSGSGNGELNSSGIRVSGNAAKELRENFGRRNRRGIDFRRTVGTVGRRSVDRESTGNRYDAISDGKGHGSGRNRNDAYGKFRAGFGGSGSEVRTGKCRRRNGHLSYGEGFSPVFRNEGNGSATRIVSRGKHGKEVELRNERGNGIGIVGNERLRYGTGTDFDGNGIARYEDRRDFERARLFYGLDVVLEDDRGNGVRKGCRRDGEGGSRKARGNRDYAGYGAREGVDVGHGVDLRAEEFYRIGVRSGECGGDGIAVNDEGNLVAGHEIPSEGQRRNLCHGKNVGHHVGRSDRRRYGRGSDSERGSRNGGRNGKDVQSGIERSRKVRKGGNLRDETAHGLDVRSAEGFGKVRSVNVEVDGISGNGIPSDDDGIYLRYGDVIRNDGNAREGGTGDGKGRNRERNSRNGSGYGKVARGERRIDERKLVDLGSERRHGRSSVAGERLEKVHARKRKRNHVALVEGTVQPNAFYLRNGNNVQNNGRSVHVARNHREVGNAERGAGYGRGNGNRTSGKACRYVGKSIYGSGQVGQSGRVASGKRYGNSGSGDGKGSHVAWNERLRNVHSDDLRDRDDVRYGVRRRNGRLRDGNGNRSRVRRGNAEYEAVIHRIEGRGYVRQGACEARESVHGSGVAYLEVLGNHGAGNGERNGIARFENARNLQGFHLFYGFCVCRRLRCGERRRGRECDRGKQGFRNNERRERSRYALTESRYGKMVHKKPGYRKYLW